MKKPQRSTFKLNPVAAAIAIALASQFAVNMAQAGSGFGNGINTSNLPVMVPTYYANSPAGPVPALNPVTGTTTINPITGLPLKVDSGKALRKFVDTLPGIGSTNANNLGQYIPVAVPEKWVDQNGVTTNDDYYEIAAIEFTEKMHSDLPKATHLRGYVQLSTAANPGLHIALTYPNGKPILDAKGIQVYAYDNPHHLGPIINATKGTAVRVKFTNYLPVGGNLFLPVDTSITGAGLGPDGKTYYTQNRAEIHLVGGNLPWISAGNPHQWVAPAGETGAYAAGMGKGVSNQNVPDMANPGNGSTTLYFPNDLSSRFMFYQDRTSGLTRLNSYAGLEAGYFITDPAEQGLIGAGAIPADQIPLIIEDKTFVPGNITQQDAKWDATHWGQTGDLWFPHVYEPNQDPTQANGVNPVGRWDFGPLFWPIFPVTQPLPSGGYGAASFTPEAYFDTPVINGTAYPTLTVDPKAYRFRILNASNDRYINLGFYKADSTVQAPQLDANGNPIVDASGNQQFFANTEVKMVPAVADVNGNPLVPTYAADPNIASRGYDCLCQYPNLPQLQPTIAFSGLTRAWPTDSRVGGAPDPTAVGPDFIQIGTDGGLLPNPVDIPSQPVTYEANRRSITVTNIYGYGMLLGPSERADAIVDFSAYAGQTLILYNDAPAPTPFNDQRNDYYTADPDLTGTGGTYSTQPGYGPNTRTMMQIKVNATQVAATGAFNADNLLTALPAAYAKSQSTPNVPESAYNAAFGTNDSDNYAHVATGSVAQPTLDFTTSGTQTITGVKLITSGGTQTSGGTIVGNPIPGSGTGYDPLNPPTVVFNNGNCLTGGATSAAAHATVDPTTLQITAVTLDNLGGYPGYTCAPTISFASTVGLGAQATVVTSNSQSVLVQTKSEQELFDAEGRYNSTGGVELPYTSATTQTTIPLSYIDSPTEMIADGETQLWKVVDNGFWSNSMHFDFVEVQLINRVGWDGTVKAPASNEVGWKDTVRLNPLEDMIVAMRAKRAVVPFGLPQSSRALDPSVALGKPGSNLGFLADPGVLSPSGVALLTNTTNVKANFDNEFVWNSAILGHSEDDFMRPVVFHPTVTKPDAPVSLAETTTLGQLTWTDPTPVGGADSNGVPTAGTNAAYTTPTNSPKNEIGFTVKRWLVSVNGAGKYVLSQGVTLGNLLANAIGFTDTTRVAGNNYVYQVGAYNVAGTSTSGIAENVPAPAAPAGLTDVISSTGAVTVSWTASTNPAVTGYVVNVNGVAQPVTTNSTYTPKLPLGNAYTITVQAQINLANVMTVNSVPSAPITVDLSAPAAPAAPTGLGVTLSGTNAKLTWTDSTTAGVTGYVVQQSMNAGATWTQVGAILGATATTATATVANGNTYLFQVFAQTKLYNSPITTTNSAAAGPVSLLTPPVAPGTPSAVVATIASASSVSLNWTASGTSGVTYVVMRKTGGGAYAQVGTSATPSYTDATVVTGYTYTYEVAAVATNGAGSTNSTYAVSNSVNMAIPAKPTNLTTAAGVIGTNNLTVTWKESPMTNVANFVLQRRSSTTSATSGFGAYTTVATIPATAATSYVYVDNGLLTTTWYEYSLTATGITGTSAAVASTSGVKPK